MTEKEAAAIAVLDRYIAALNARDAEAKDSDAHQLGRTRLCRRIKDKKSNGNDESI